MAEEVINTTINKTDIKLTSRKVIPITSISDLGTVVGDIQNQLTLLLNKLEDEVSPEFKALMEGYVNKANQSEEFKVNLDHIRSYNDELKTEIAKARETNRNLVNELQNAREILRKLEQELNTYQEASKKSEEELKDKIKRLSRQNLENENKIKQLEEDKTAFAKEQEKLRKEFIDQNFETHQKLQELTLQRDNLKKHTDEFDDLLKELSEKLDLKSKEAEYKDALLNQLIKQTTIEKLRTEQEENTKDKLQKKRNFLFFKL